MKAGGMNGFIQIQLAVDKFERCKAMAEPAACLRCAGVGLGSRRGRAVPLRLFHQSGPYSHRDACILRLLQALP